MSKLTKDLERLVATMGRLAKPVANEATAEAYAAHIIDSIKAIPKVAAVSMNGQHLQINTKVLSIPFRKQRKVVGAIQMSIPTKVVPGARVTFSNLTSEKLYEHLEEVYTRGVHPHVDSYGNACFGEIHGSVQDLLQRQMFPELVRVLMTYLQSINMRDNIAVQRADSLPTKAVWNKKHGVEKLT
jgi:hypothetical protein